MSYCSKEELDKKQEIADKYNKKWCREKDSCSSFTLCNVGSKNKLKIRVFVGSHLLVNPIVFYTHNGVKKFLAKGGISPKVLREVGKPGVSFDVPITSKQDNYWHAQFESSGVDWGSSSRRSNSISNTNLPDLVTGARETSKCTYSYIDGVCGTHGTWNGACAPKK